MRRRRRARPRRQRLANRTERVRCGSLAQDRWRLSVTRWDHPATSKSSVGRRYVDERKLTRTVGTQSLGLGTAAASAQFRCRSRASLFDAAPNTLSVPGAMAFAGSVPRPCSGSIRRTGRSFASEDIADVTLKARSAERGVARAPLLRQRTVADAMIAVVSPSSDRAGCERLDLLGWLLARETRDGHLSVTPPEGSGPGDVGPA